MNPADWCLNRREKLMELDRLTSKLVDLKRMIKLVKDSLKSQDSYLLRSEASAWKK
jgi:hypothetical protein